MYPKNYTFNFTHSKGTKEKQNDAVKYKSKLFSNRIIQKLFR